MHITVKRNVASIQKLLDTNYFIWCITYYCDMIKMQIKRYSRYTGSVQNCLMQPGIFMKLDNLNGLMKLI